MALVHVFVCQSTLVIPILAVDRNVCKIQIVIARRPAPTTSALIRVPEFADVTQSVALLVIRHRVHVFRASLVIR